MMLKELHPNIRIRIYTSFLSRVIGSMIFPFMAIYFTKELNAMLAAVLVMAQTAAQFMASLYGGFLADTLGRKRVMVTGEALKLGAFLGMLVANSPLWHSPWFTFFMLMIISVGSGIITPAADAMLVDVSTKETRAFMYSINYWASNLSLMMGLMVGGWFFQTHFFALIAALFVMTVLTLSMTVILIKETYYVKKTARPHFLKSYQSVMKDGSFLLYTLGGVAVLSIEFQRNNFISIRLAEEVKTRLLFGHIPVDGVKLISWLTVENTLFIVLFTAFITKWVLHKNEKVIMYSGFLLFSIGYGLMAVSNHILLLIISVAILSIGELLYVPTRQALMVDLIDETRRGSYMAFNGLTFQIAKMVGALGIMMGQIIGNWGMAIFYLVLAMAGILFCHSALQRRAFRPKTKLSV